MNKTQLLTVTSLLSIVFLMLHIADDISRGFDSTGISNMIPIAVVVALVYGILIYRDRSPGIIAAVLVAVFAVGMPVLHLRSARINEIAQSSGGLFFIFTLWALGVTGMLGIVLSIQVIWRWWADRRVYPNRSL